MKHLSFPRTPVFEIKDDAECIKIARACGLDTKLFQLRLVEHNLKTKEPSFGAVILEHEPEVLILLFFTGYEHARQNGWYILGCANPGVYAARMPQLMRLLFDEAHNISCSPLTPDN